MKFWKSLSNLIEETLPDWRDKFLSYKDLKKQLKLICPKESESPRNLKRPRLEAVDSSRDPAVAGPGDCAETLNGAGEMAKEVADFERLLEDEMEKFNGFFVEKEEEYVIRWKELEERVTKAKESNEELMEVGREVVDFHGEMILLENYSALNYTGLVKILKKYDKRSGTLIRLPFIQRILQQPFYTTDLLDQLVKECETMLDSLFTVDKALASGLPEAPAREGLETKMTAPEYRESTLKVPKELVDIERMESMYMKLTLSALRVLKEIRSGSSTVSMFSLPPLQGNAAGQAWEKAPVLEQTAK